MEGNEEDNLRRNLSPKLSTPSLAVYPDQLHYPYPKSHPQKHHPFPVLELRQTLQKLESRDRETHAGEKNMHQLSSENEIITHESQKRFWHQLQTYMKRYLLAAKVKRRCCQRSTSPPGIASQDGNRQAVLQYQHSSTASVDPRRRLGIEPNDG
jgi:hypothetical protein